MRPGSYWETKDPRMCFGCEACVQQCGLHAIHMEEDREGFRYPRIDPALCVSCGSCRRVCPAEQEALEYHSPRLVFGGHHTNPAVQRDSTSGGAFSAIASGWCTGDSVIFGAAADKLRVYHCYAAGGSDIGLFRKSKYVQSEIGQAYQEARTFLRAGRKVLFSGTPCQIAALQSFLRGEEQENLLTVEVVCEGVPSPKFIRKYDSWLRERYGGGIQSLDYRNKERPKWDFQVMRLTLENGRKLSRDRWFSPFWFIWLSHLMSRPSCYRCPFARPERTADITLGDLWGVHLYCPELYDRNRGASLILCNTDKGTAALALAKKLLEGHELALSEALRYQGPLRGPIRPQPLRSAFMEDLDKLPYDALCRKWAKRPSIKLLWSKYVWGNQQKMFLWNLRCRDRKQESRP